MKIMLNIYFIPKQVKTEEVLDEASEAWINLWKMPKFITKCTN